MGATMRTIAAVAMLVVGASVARAQDAASARAVDCANATTQGAMNACAARDRAAADTELDAAFEALQDRVSDEGRDALDEAQRAWIAYRDAQCAFESAGTAGGSVHPMIVATCRAELTRARTERLVRQLECEEGDLSCGGQ